MSNTYINLTFESKIDWVKKINEYQEEIKRLKEEYMILQNASDEVEEEKDKEIERLNTNLEVANEDLTRIAQLLNLEEGCTIYDIEDKIGKYKSIIKEVREYIKDNFSNEDKSIWHEDMKKILRILDKESNETNEVMSVEELEKYEPKNMAELEYQEWFWEDNE